MNREIGVDPVEGKDKTIAYYWDPFPWPPRGEIKINGPDMKQFVIPTERIVAGKPELVEMPDGRTYVSYPFTILPPMVDEPTIVESEPK